MAEVAIRQAGEGDVERLLEMYEWLFEQPGIAPGRWDRERGRAAVGAAIASGESTVLVAESASGALVGFASAYLDLDSVRFGRRCWVEDLAVDPDQRSAGIGKALLDAAKAWARERGATHLELDTGLARTDAQRFYEREQPVAKSYSYSWAL